jgi:ABC-2 type transport system permease protein
MVQKEMRQLLRDPKTKRMTFAAPIIQLLLFGYAVNTDVRDLSTIVVDQDQTAVSRLLQDKLTASGYFEVVGRSDRVAAVEEALDAGTAVVGLQIPPGFTARMEAGERSEVQLLIDGTSSNTATVAQGYAGRIVQEFASERAAEQGLTVEGGIELRSRAWFNPDLASQDYNVPGIIGLLLMLMALLLTALGVVRERELGTLEQLMVSPISSREMILGKTIPVVVICLIDLALITTLAVLWFDIPLRGSLATLVAASFLYILAGLGFGLLISTISRTQQEAFLTMFLFFLPAIILSGFMYPVDTMPAFFQDLSRLNPIRYFMEMVRNIFLKGHGFSELWLHFIVVGIMAVGALFAAVSRFKKSLE